MRAKKSVSIKTLAALLAVVLVLGCAVGGTLAWLAVKSEPVVNTFTTSNIDITLTESTEEFQMVPGTDIAKDPVVTVAKGSEPCWLFVKIDESENLRSYIEYTVNTKWDPVYGVDNVYYMEIDLSSASADGSYPVLMDNEVHVFDTVTKAMMDAAATNKPTMTFTAYAVQKEGFRFAEDAWLEAQKLG